MPAPSKVTIVLADEDALRRDGLAAVLAGGDSYEVVASVPDGTRALQEIRERKPQVAVVDLNLPGIHGIELVRRVRSEALGTRIVILAGTSDDEIVREVVRAGGDGYLLKNGPARHLLDAINYVRDGGQYFSPQLRRDGRDRHLLEEPPREVPAREGARPAEEHEPASGAAAPGPGRERYELEDDEEAGEERDSRPARSARTRARGPARRPGSNAPWRDRMRREAGSSLDDRDYEIVSMMADGIRPILDRLEEIDNRVALMEVGDAPVPESPRDWLNHELADTLTRSGDLATVPHSARELEARLPEMIEEAVTRRFNQMAGKLQQEIEETHVRTLETFVKNIQVKLVQRVSALEQDMSKQAEAMNQLREYSQRTEDNLSRLITGVDKLAQDLPRRLAAAAAAENTQPAGGQPVSPAQSAPRRKAASRSRVPRMAMAGLAAVVVISLAVWGAGRLIRSDKRAPETAAASGMAASAPAKASPPAALADTKTKLQAAQQYVDQKDYSMAEDIYKQILQSEPKNVDALQGLASVLYREDKIDEAAQILDRIPK